jgi:TonB family protein
MSRSARALLSGAAISLLLHLAIAVLLPSLGDVEAAQRAHRHARDLEIALEIDRSAAGDATRARSPGAAAPVTPGGADVAHNIDARDRGAGGDRTGARSVIVLLPRAEGITLQDSPMNAIERAQAQRIETARDRASAEDRRATPSPDDDPFLASGDGVHRERRPLAATDARVGARAAPIASSAGAPAAGADLATPSRDGLLPGAPSVGVATVAPRGALLDSPGAGILEGRGVRASERARVALGRPTVDQARAATTTEERDPRTRDDVDAELLAARMVQSVVDATERRGTTPGDGRGGAIGEGATGIGGGAHEGGRARALGPGTGSWDALDTGDDRYLRWYVDARRRIERALVFPRARELAMDQGTSIFTIVVRRDGSLARAPRLLRSSGFSDLDGAALAAIRRTVPFDPIPEALAPGRSSIRVTIPIEFSNPMVR